MDSGIATTRGDDAAPAESFFDVIIIGAGISGLSCADRLLERSPGLKVVVLEGLDRVGGRTKTIEMPVEVSTDQKEPKRMKADAGGMWLGPTQKHMLKLCERFNIETIPQRYQEGKHTLTRGTHATRKVYTGDIPPYSIFSLLEIQFLVLNRVDSLMQYVPIDAPEKCPYAKEWDAHSVSSFFAQSLWTSGTKEVVELVSWTLFGCQATQISLLFFLWICRICGGLKMLTDTTGGAQDRRMVGGAQQVSEKLKAAFEQNGGQVLFNTKIVAVEQSPDATPHRASVISAVGRVFRAKIIVSAGCVSKFLLKCSFTPPLPRPVQRFADITFRGAYAKAIVVYKTAWWRTAGYSGFMTNTKPTLEACACLGYDYGPDPALVCFIVGDICEQVCDLPEQKRRESILNSIALLYPDQAEKARTEVVSYHDEYWQTNEFSGGCPMTLYPPGTFLEYSAKRLLQNPMASSRDTWKQPVLFFAGTELANEWVGYMEGALVRGTEVAEQVVEVLSDRVANDRRVTEDENAHWVPVAI